MELTKWYLLSEQKPWQPGVYIVLRGEDEGWSYWCGERFHGAWSIPQEAVTAFHRKLVLTSFISVWRGLASDPAPKPSPMTVKPKRSGNPEVTRYVVIQKIAEKTAKIAATFSSLENANIYADKLKTEWRIQKIVFRSPEASNS